jgi:hypothetical protein
MTMTTVPQLNAAEAGGRLMKLTKTQCYYAEMESGPACHFPTITAAREWAEQFGNTATECRIYLANAHGNYEKLVAIHNRDMSKDGMRWFRATV